MFNTESGILRMVLLLFLSAIIIIGGVIIWVNYKPGESFAISVEDTADWEGNVYIGGSVKMPGFYPCDGEDCLQTLINAAGGLLEEADITSLTLIANQTQEPDTAQKVNINRAEPWLIEALPGIGETLSARIYDYRIENGPFSTTRELLQVEGIGQTVYDSIEPYVTVSD